MATDPIISERFSSEFAKFSNVHIFDGYFQNLKGVDCLVTPGNSFGLMDGGMDAEVTHYFGEQLQDKVQDYILENYYGEQPVGTSFIVETGNSSFPYLAHTPTMRIPMNISQTDSVYRATRATLMVTENHDNIKNVAIPAFGYGSGFMIARDVAYQMSKAFLQILSKPDKITWDYAVNTRL